MNIGVGSAGVSFKYIGTEACGSLTCYKYQVTDSTTPSATQYVWFDNSSYKLRQWQYSDGSGNTTDMTVTYATVNITKPSPVEDLSATE
jgi:outer membrane lipoprotein-sorting protein